MAETSHTRHGAHPTPFTYFKVAALLAALTGLEVGVFYIDALESAFLPIFLVLSVFKFVLVVLFYMHLKFDSRLFSGMFVGGVLLAIVVAVALMSIFQVLSSVANPRDGVLEVVAADVPRSDPDLPPKVPEVPEPTVQLEATPDVTEPEPTDQAEPTPQEPPPAPTPTEAPTATDLAAVGKDLFVTPPTNVGQQPLWCSTCHKLDAVPESIGGIGPDLSAIASTAGTRKAGLSADAYIRESIKSPEVFIVEGYTPGLMTQAVAGSLTDEQVDALVAFLLSEN